MQLGKLINRSLDKALNMIGDQAIPAVFHLKKVGDFDFTSGEPTESDKRDVVVKVVLLDSKKVAEGVQYKNLLLKAIDDLDMYDQVTLGGEKWTIGLPIVGQGPTQLIEVFRGL